MQEARVKRGLTYGIGSLVSFQRYYGREFIRTSTRNNSTGEMLKVIKNILDETGAGKITDEEWAASLGHLSGSYLFKFEDNDAYLSNIVYFDHVGRNVSELYNFPQIIKTYNPQLVSQKINEIFDWPKQVIMILGAPTIKKDLKTFGQVIELDYHKFL